MYLRDSDECEVLLRLIDDCDRLVENKAISAGAAYTVVSEAAKHHSDHPVEKRKRAAALEKEKAEKASTEVSVPVAEPPSPEAMDAVNAF
jgi:hypothetical protein